MNLGSVVVPASGIATITVPSALQDGNAHTIALLQADNTVVAWGNVVVPAPEFALETETPLTAEVTVSGKFALEGVGRRRFRSERPSEARRPLRWPSARSR